MSLIINHLSSHFDSVWGVDFEYNTGDSEADAPKPICMVAHELFTGVTIRKWLWDGAATECPLPTDERSLYVAFYASAEITCHLGLGWPIPARILDLYAEFRCVANSLANFQVTSVKGKTKGQQRFSLLNCMRSFGLGAEAVGTGFKNESRDLCIRGGPFSEAENITFSADFAAKLEASTSEVELVVNGYPVAKQEVKSDGSKTTVKFKHRISESCWVAMRVFPNAHTNPIYITVNDQSILGPMDSIRWCLAGVEQCWKSKQSVYAVDEQADAEAAYEHARKVYSDLIPEAEARD